MNKPLRVGFVVNFEPTDPPGPWLGAYLPASDYRTELLAALPPPRTFFARHRWLPPYVDEFFQLARQRPRLDAYDILFTWELRNTLATILLRRLTRQRRARLISLNPTLKGWTVRALPVVRRLLRDADRIVCFSTAECEEQSRQLRLPVERFQYVPRFAEEKAERPPARMDGAETFVLALGHSNRDFPTLWDALRGTDLRVTMYRNSYMPGRELANIHAIPSILPAEDEDALVERAVFHVIPLKAAAFSSGLTVLLRAMAHGKAVVVSNTTGIRDYVRDGETAILVPPGDPVALRAAMLRLWSDPRECRRIGGNAARAVREQFATPHFARQLGEIANSAVAANGTFAEVLCES